MRIPDTGSFSLPFLSKVAKLVVRSGVEGRRHGLGEFPSGRGEAVFSQL